MLLPPTHAPNTVSRIANPQKFASRLRRFWPSQTSKTSPIAFLALSASPPHDLRCGNFISVMRHNADAALLDWM